MYCTVYTHARSFRGGNDEIKTKVWVDPPILCIRNTDRERL